MGREDRDRADRWPSAESFQHFLSHGLGSAWEVEIVAQRPALPVGGSLLSVAAVASRPDGVRMRVSHDRGADVVTLSLAGGPPVPFEDFAVAKGEMETRALIMRGVDALEKPPGVPAFDLETILRLVREWDGQLAEDLSPANLSMAGKLAEISKTFEEHMALHPAARRG